MHRIAQRKVISCIATVLDLASFYDQMLLELGLKVMTSVGAGTLLWRKMFLSLGLVINKQCMLSY